MKAQKLEVIKEFMGKRLGTIINPPRQDVAKSLVEQGYCKYIIVDVEQEALGNQVVGKPIILEPKTEQNDNSNNKRGEESAISEGSIRTTKQRRGRKSGKSKA
jgi:hypothetical protein